MTPENITEMFSDAAGSYKFARWGRPIVPVVFGVEDATLKVVKGAIEAVVSMAGHKMAEHDPELGANLLIFFLRDWSELAEVKDMDQLVPNMGPLLDRLTAQEANQYRLFRFDDAGAIQACFLFLRVDAAMQDMAAEDIALGQAAQMMLVWGASAFSAKSPLAHLPDGKGSVLRPDVAAIIRASYDATMPVAANDPAHALRIFARVGDFA
ncbi:MAG: hypothetical protein ACSHXD_18070 [Marinosulfonomonas sp.]